MRARQQLVVRAIKGKQVADAASILRFLPHSSARDVASVLKSATANAEANHGIPAERLWVNPDCGLKTRGWPETEAALVHMVNAARQLRKELA